MTTMQMVVMTVGLVAVALCLGFNFAMADIAKDLKTELKGLYAEHYSFKVAPQKFNVRFMQIRAKYRKIAQRQFDRANQRAYAEVAKENEHVEKFVKMPTWYLVNRAIYVEAFNELIKAGMPWYAITIHDVTFLNSEYATEKENIAAAKDALWQVRMPRGKVLFQNAEKAGLGE